MSTTPPVKPVQLYKLGRKPAKRDIRTLDFVDYLVAPALPAIPATFSYLNKVTTGWPMFDNDRLGDCVPAGMFHQVQLWTAANGHQFIPTDPQVIQTYSAISGYNPATGANDNGCDVLTAMNYWKNTGIAGHKIDAFVSVNTAAHKKIMQAVWLCLGVGLGINLPISTQAQVTNGQVWSYVAGPNAIPGSWGGHYVYIVSFSPSKLGFISWGKYYEMTWQFFDLYSEEAFAPLSKDSINGATNRAPNSINWAHLQADLNALKAA